MLSGVDPDVSLDKSVENSDVDSVLSVDSLLSVLNELSVDPYDVSVDSPVLNELFKIFKLISIFDENIR